MVSHEWALGALIWCMVYSGLAAFFVVSGRLFPRRGYELLGAALALIAVSALGMWVIIERPESRAEGVGEYLVFLCAAFAPALNTHFLFYFSGKRQWRRLASLGYVLGAAGALAELASGGSAVRSLAAHPASSTVVAKFLTVLLGVHLVVGAILLGHGLRSGRRRALFPLICIVLLGPAATYDFASFALYGQTSLLTETLVWIYALSIVWGLLSELRGAEGLLEETTSSLAERTAQLQVSYAELELVHSELSKKEQLAAVGELAAAIAHEVRNPLAIITNAASGLRRPNLTDSDRETLLSIVDEESERLNELVTELLRFARPVEAARAPTSLQDICEKARAAVPDGYEVHVERTVNADLEAIWVDPGLFRLAIDNLMANAVQAMPDGGPITITLGHASFADGEPAESISVQDAGQGMTEEELERARKPFFTTKPRGTGLGLPIAERIVDAHGGQLSIRSQKGEGTTVTLLVPAEQGEGPYAVTKAPSTRRRFRTNPRAVSNIAEQAQTAQQMKSEKDS